ncbi:hypothetical protein RhiJN_09042 [Ceratobasidium sp. AG-Ba]|nr:hypothetical protein RhiJN_09042 [Ceratobasidium sp. AG-Ba]
MITLYPSLQSTIIQSGFNYAYSVPFPKDCKIATEQAFEALRAKSRDPRRFISGFSSAQVLEETPRYIKRKEALARNGLVQVEDLDLYPPTLVVFKADTGSVVTNVISKTAAGDRFLSFTFDMKEMSLVAENREEGIIKAKATVEGSMKAISEMFDNGELN